ncbi:MAG: hypothetical protein IJ722_07150 [Alloprevotella sp.]|nr:hypothetical protein [Alloprevotella sp.]
MQQQNREQERALRAKQSAEKGTKAYVPPRMQVLKLETQLLAASRQAICEVIPGTRWYDTFIYLRPQYNSSTSTLVGTRRFCNDPQLIIDKWSDFGSGSAAGPDGLWREVSLYDDLGDGVTLREVLLYGTILPGCDFDVVYDATGCSYTSWTDFNLCYLGKGYRIHLSYDS